MATGDKLVNLDDLKVTYDKQQEDTNSLKSALQSEIAKGYVSSKIHQDFTDSEKEQARNNIDSASISEVVSLVETYTNKKVNMPLNQDESIDYGESGEVLRTNGNGSTYWAMEGLPTDEQTASAVTAWLNNHPEATTTVTDGSITTAKLSTSLKNKAMPNISPQDFEGTDAQKLQAAVNYSIANGFPAIVIDKEYDITGATINITKGIRITDEVSQYSRTILHFIGAGKGLIKKTDTGFMFSSEGVSGDIAFDGVKFRGLSTTDLPDNCIDMKVFDCRNLIRLYITNCTFTWCGCVYYQNDVPSYTCQSVSSIGNLYAKNKDVINCLNIYDVRFTSDLIEDGVHFANCNTIQANTRCLRILDCCIEGMSGEAINLKGVCNNCVICDNYFEANVNHIVADRLFVGDISNNTFFGRGNLSADLDIDCINICTNRALIFKGNYQIDANAKTLLIRINTESPYYSARFTRILGMNYTSGANKTNLPEAIIDLNDENTLNSIKELGTRNTVDITEDVNDAYSDIITSGSVVFVKTGQLKIIYFLNAEFSDRIIGGSVASIQSLLKPTNGAATCALNNDFIQDQSYVHDKTALAYINTDGTFGIRLGHGGIVNGQLVYS